MTGGEDRRQTTEDGYVVSGVGFQVSGLRAEGVLEKRVQSGRWPSQFGLIERIQDSHDLILITMNDNIFNISR